MISNRICIFFREPPLADRWHKGDHAWRAKVRRIIRGPDKIGGVKSVFVNLTRGLERLGVNFVTNISYNDVRADDLVGVLGLGCSSLDGYNKKNPVLAGIAVVQHPRDCPNLFDEYPVASYAVHSNWVKAMFERHYGPRISTWAVGIDTQRWAPADAKRKTVDFLIYDKVMWDHDRVHEAMVSPILSTLTARGLCFEVIRYGHYHPDHFRTALARSKAMLFLCEHELQGLAYQQAMSCGVPILAWDPGVWLDPWRFRDGEIHVPATSVPFFDDRCGRTFIGVPDFADKLDDFLDLMRFGKFSSRDYVLENLTLEGCAQTFITLLRDVSN